MRTYAQTARIIGMATIKNWVKEEYDVRFRYIHGLKERKDFRIKLKLITKINQLHEEGLTIDQIYNELNLDNPETSARSLIETWSYPEEFNFEKIKEVLDNINKHTDEDIALEELMMFMLTNFAYALKIKMAQ